MAHESAKPIEALEDRRLLTQDLMFDAASATAAGSGTNGAVVMNIDSITINATIRNRGNENATRADMKVILTRDFEIPGSDSEDISIGKLRVPELADGEVWSVEHSFEVTDVPSGQYYVFLKLKPDDNKVDSFFGNNTGDRGSNNMIFTGAKFTIQGSAAPDDPGLVTGGVKVKLSGRGVLSVTRREDGRFDVEASGTNTGSKLSITDDRGFNYLGNIVVHGPLSKFETKVALPGNLTIEGDVKELSLRYVNNSIITLGGSRQAVKITANDVDGASIVSSAPLSKLETGPWLAGTQITGRISAPLIKELKIGGTLQADVYVSGLAGKTAIEKAQIDDFLMSHTFVAKGAVKLLRTDAVKGDVAVTVLGELQQLDLRGDVVGKFSAAGFKTVRVRGDLSDSMFLAGAFLGDDARLGGEGDIFGAGVIKEFNAGRDVVRTTIGAGVNPVNGVLNDGDDVFVTAPGSRMDKIIVDEDLFQSRFISPRFPAKVSVGGHTIVPSSDPRFISVLP